MAAPKVLTGATLAAGLRSDFMDAWKQDYEGVLKNLGDVMSLSIPSDKRTELYAARRTMPYPERWDYGDPIPEEGTDSKAWNVTNYRYAKRVGWLRDDREDNQVGDLRGDAQALGSHFASLPSKFLIEVMTASPTLLPAIPNAPDEVALYNTTDETGGARFGVTGGNIVTGTGVTAAQIEADWFSAIIRFAEFLNTKGEPFFDPDTQDERYVIYFGVANFAAFQEAFRANIVHSVISTTGAGVSNVIMSAGTSVLLRGTGRITDNDWFLFRADSTIKAVFVQDREGIRMSQATDENSDESRDTGKEYVQFVERLGVGVNIPYATVKVDN